MVLFFSRGKGRGHAVPDAAIARELLRIEPALSIKFVSYSAGAVALRERGFACFDLGLGDDPLPWDVLHSGATVIARERPELVLIHEEFALPPVVGSLGCRCLFLTDWIPAADTLSAAALKYADEILFLDEPGHGDLPPWLASRIHYFGVVLRPLETGGLSKLDARAQLGLPGNAAVILVAPGGSQMHTEERAPLFDLVRGGFDRMEVAGRPKVLLWVAGHQDFDDLTRRARGRSDIRVLRPHAEFTRTMLAADIVITKGNRLPLFECEVLGKRSLSISYGLNPIDDCRVAQIPTNSSLRARGIDPIVLAGYLERTLNLPPAPPADLKKVSQRTTEVAARIHRHLTQERNATAKAV